MTAQEKATAYQARFKVKLRYRLMYLIPRFPSVKAPNWFSWEGGTITGVDTTRKARNLLRKLSNA